MEETINSPAEPVIIPETNEQGIDVTVLEEKMKEAEKESVKSTLSQAEALRQITQSPGSFETLMRMLGAKQSKRGITKPVFNKAKARARNKVQKASRKANRGVNRGKGKSKAFLNRAGAPR